MQTYLLMLGMVLVGQVSDLGNDRYQSGAATGGDYSEFSTQNEQTPPGNNTANNYPAESAEAARPLPTSNAAPLEGNPAELLESLAKRSPSSKLSGLPISLSDALAGASSRVAQSQRVQLYWRLATAVMEYDLALRELTELSALQQSILRPGQTWTQVRNVANSNLQVKQQAARVLQHQLQAELGRKVQNTNTLPLPSDRPLCGAYESRYEELFRNRNVPEAAALHQLLLNEYPILRRQAGSVSAARQWLDTVSAQRSSQSDGTELLQAYQSFASARKLFLQGVNNYNSHIARYTELATPERVDTQRLVAMLIKTDSLQWNGEGIRRTSAEEPAGSDSRQQPRTYVEPGRSESRRVPAPESKSEHSIIVE